MSEDVNGLPDVQGLGDFVQATMTQDKAAQEPAQKPNEQQAEPASQSQTDDQLDLGQFKSTKDLLKSYKEIQGFTTRVSQELKQKDSVIQQLQEQLELMRVPVGQPMAQSQPQQKTFDELFIQNPEAAIAQTVNAQVRQGLQMAQIEGVLSDEAGKNPQEFNERYAYARLVAQQYPHLVQSAAGVKKLFEHGDKMRKEAMRRNAERSVGLLLGDDVDLEKFKALVKKDQQATTQNQNLAYMPDSTMSTRSGADAGPTKQRPDAINEAVQRGDVDSVISGIFKNALNA